MPIFNYVREHRRFIRYASDNKLTSSERLLWYALVEIINEESEGNAWPDGFIRISNNRLLTLCDPMGIDTMVRARNGLKQRGLIDYKPGNKNKENPAYQIRLFYPDGYTQNAYNIQGNIQGNMQGNMQYNQQGNTTRSTGDIYINQNMGYNPTKTLTDDEDNENDVFRACAEDDPIPDRKERESDIRAGFFRAFGRMPYPAETNRLVYAGWKMGFSGDMIGKALEIAAGCGAMKPVDYTFQILNEWESEEVMQPHQVDIYRVQRDMQIGKNGMFGTGDITADYSAMEAARKQRAHENAEAL